MKKSMEVDLTDLSDILESFVKKLEKLSQPELIDLAARLKPIAKHCKTIDEHVKGVVKAALEHVAGDLPGTQFIAKLALISVTRVDIARLKEEKPAVYDAFSNTDNEERITFHLR